MCPSKRQRRLDRKERRLDRKERYNHLGLAKGRPWWKGLAPPAPGLRLLPGRFMAIDQAMAVPRDRSQDAVNFVQAFLRAQQTGGALRQAFERHGIEGATLLEAG